MILEVHKKEEKKNSHVTFRPKKLVKRKVRKSIDLNYQEN
jgi:hypothetical protein